MKKIFVLVVVLAISSAAMAGTITVQVDPQDAKTGYEASDTITIQLVSSGFADQFTGSLGKMYIDNIISSSAPTAGKGGTAVSINGLCAELKELSPYKEGTIVNAGTDPYVLITDIAGSRAAGGMTGVPNATVVYSFEFHVPDAPYSTYITINLDNLVTQDVFSGPVASTAASLEIHVVPEPITIALLGLGGLFLRRRK